jgi:hypothetical protein
MSNELIVVLVFFQVVSAAYVMYYHNKNYTLGLDMIIGAILLGPILALLINDDVKEYKKQRKITEDNNNRMDNSYRRWFQLNDRINGERMRSNWYRTIPPPPPISRINRAVSERDDAIRTARERISKNKIKDFKFFR